MKDASCSRSQICYMQNTCRRSIFCETDKDYKQPLLCCATHEMSYKYEETRFFCQGRTKCAQGIPAESQYCRIFPGREEIFALSSAESYCTWLGRQGFCSICRYPAQSGIEGRFCDQCRLIEEGVFQGGQGGRLPTCSRLF